MQTDYSVYFYCIKRQEMKKQKIEKLLELLFKIYLLTTNGGFK